MKKYGLLQRIALGVALATAAFVIISSILILMNDWKSLQKEIDEHMEQNTKQVYKMLQMLHEFAKINTRSQLTMLKSFLTL